MERARELKKKNLFVRLSSKIAIYDVAIFIFFFMLSKATLLSQVAPFGVAIYTILFSQKRKISMFFAFALGTLLSLWDITALRYILSAGIITSVIGIAENKSKNTFFNAMVSFLSCLFTAAVFYQSKGSLYDLIINLFEAFLCFVTVMLTTSAFPIIFNYKKRTYISFSEALSLISLFSIIILCLCSVPDIFGLEPSSFIALFFIMSICYVSPLSVAISAGAVFGTMLSLGKFSSASSIGAYVIIAISGGLLKSYGRLGVVLGATLANAIITAFFSDGAQMLVNPIEILISGMLFWGAPKKLIASIGDFFDKISISKACESYEPICYDESRLHSISNSLKTLSDIYYMDCTRRLVGKQYILRMFDYTADKVCNGCGLKFGCWQSGNMNIYAYMTNMLKTAEQRGELSVKDLPSAFKGRCVKKDEFVKAFNFMYDIYKTDSLWLDKMGEFRTLMAGQMKGMSETIKSLSKDFCLTRDLNIESVIKSRLENIGKYPLWIYVYIKNNNLSKVCMNFEKHTPETSEISKIEQIVEEVTQTPLRVCNDTQNNMLIFCPREKYSVTYAHEQRSKCDESLCGDGFLDMSCEGGSFVSVISDGMGSGEEAYKESRDTLRLIGAYINAGFSTEMLLSLVNSSLLLRSIKDCFSTVDLFTVDLKSGQGVMSKLGASTTYIKTEKNVYKIDCTALPVGILKNVEAQNTKFFVDKWAMVIMMSDGIANTIYEGKKENDWIYNEIQGLNTHNPHVVAKKIMEKAIIQSGGRVEDDMTITVINIMKNE